MRINPKNIKDLINSITDSAPEKPTMFYAFCSECQDIRLFEFAECESCGVLWQPLAELAEKPFNA